MKISWHMRHRKEARPALLFLRQGLAYVADKSWMRRPAQPVILARLAQAQLAIHGHPRFSGVFGVLAIIFPPANRAELHRIRQRKRASATAGAAKSNIGHISKTDVGFHFGDYRPLRLPDYGTNTFSRTCQVVLFPGASVTISVSMLPHSLPNGSAKLNWCSTAMKFLVGGA